jgi:omega-6 fatty acid desaturase (delta-12 desaturase)
LGTGLYYLVEIWAKQMIFPPYSVLPHTARRRMIDTFLAGSFFLFQIFTIIVIHYEFDQVISLKSLTFDIIIAIVVPFLILNWLLGYVSFLNHTHPQVLWFDTPENWSFETGQIQYTVHMTVPFWLVFFMTDLGLHATHHIEPRVPIWKLTQTQESFLKTLNGEGVFERWSPKLQSTIFAKCKLYDYQNHQWLDFAGKATTTPIFVALSATGRQPGSPDA